MIYLLTEKRYSDENVFGNVFVCLFYISKITNNNSSKSWAFREKKPFYSDIHKIDCFKLNDLILRLLQGLKREIYHFWFLTTQLSFKARQT